ncbi:MAG TPA: glycosyltransferase, partial [Acidimicrobiia bacterium]|nr:glycosyltransferase [Acidimicrobiia bacterium]
VTLATPEERAEFEADRAALEARYSTVFRSVQVFDRPVIPGHMAKRRDILSHLRFHTRHGLPLMDVSYYTPEVVDAARRLVDRGAIDVIEVDHAQLAYVRRFVDDVPAILVMHNIEGDVHPFWMTSRWNLPELLTWRAFASVSRRNTRRVEIGNAFGFSSKLFISPLDMARVGDECPKHLLPVPFEVTDDARTFSRHGLRLLWLGGFDWPPNAEGMRWFLDHVWPLLESEPEIQLDVVGAHPPADIADRADSRVRIHGFVDDISTVKARADVLVAPLLAGSGVRVKVVEALAAGMPVVTTPKGLEGLTAEAGRDLLVASDAEGFAAAIGRLHRSVDLRRALGLAARDYIASTHAPEAVAPIKAAALESAVESGPS